MTTSPITFTPLRSLAPFSAAVASEREAISSAAKNIAGLKVDCADIGFKGLEITVLERILLSQALKAIQGDTAAFNAFIKEYANGGADKGSVSLTLDAGMLAMIQALGLDAKSLINLEKGADYSDFE